MKILLRLWDSPDKMGFAEGRDEGGSVKELYKKGFLEPTGRDRRRIRWRLVSGRLRENDVISMRKLVILQYSGYEIIKWSDGFKLVPNSLNIVASFIVKKENFVAGFAFRVGYLDWVAKQLREKKEETINKALKVIEDYLTNKEVKNLEEYTFEYYFPDFVKVDNPKWWIKSK
ncbi:hypothetical protein KKC08_02815 [Patescibacteria group bacterium]|nr:hypothetical protein [Patescibacteria group bacterium]